MKKYLTKIEINETPAIIEIIRIKTKSIFY